MNIRRISIFVCFILVVVLLCWTAAFGLIVPIPFTGSKYMFPAAFDTESGIRRGLDLVGGSRISFEADAPNPTDEEMRAAEQVMRNRLDARGYFDASVTLQGNNIISIEIPNISNPEEAVQMLGATAKLYFTDSEGNEVMSGTQDYVSNATYQYGRISEGGAMMHYVLLEFTAEGRQKFAEATGDAAAKSSPDNVIGIKLDEDEISRPSVKERIDNDSCTISGSFTEDTARALASQIKSGQLPFDLKEAELRSVGPQLGEESLELSLLAAAIGIGLVAIFMIAVYKLPGALSVVALALYISLVALVMAGYFMPGDFRATLTLPGIAGIILSIGMAVDANVIIFERIKEEMRLGKTVRASVEAGYNRALTAVIDANVTTVIATAVLWYFGTGPIKGFALTLFIGIVLSMITAVIITRYLLNVMVAFNVKNPVLYGLRKEASSQ